MNSKNVKEVINSVVSNVVDADSQLFEHFNKTWMPCLFEKA